MIYWATGTIRTSFQPYHDVMNAGGLRWERWTEMPHGGRFAALEEPQRLAEELRAFFRPLRRSR